MNKIVVLFCLINVSICMGQPLYYLPSTDIRIEDKKVYTTGFGLNKLNSEYNLQTINAIFYQMRLFIIEEKLDSARVLLEHLDQQSFQRKDHVVQIATCYYKGKLDATEGLYENAFMNYVKADSIALTRRNFEYHNYIQLGLVELYRKQSNYEDALDLLHEIKGNLFVSNMDTFAVIEYYNRYAAILNESSKDRMNYIDSSVKYSNRAILLCEKIKSNNRLAVSYNEIGFSYELRNNIEAAISYYQKACKYWSKTSSYRNYLNSLLNLARAYSKQKKYHESNAILDKITEQAESTKWIRLLASLYDLKYTNMESVGDYQSGMKYLKLAVEYRDKVAAENNSITLAKLEKKYKADKDERKQQDLQRQNQVLNSRLKWLMITLFIMGVIFISVIYLYLKAHKNNKLNSLKNVHLENSQKELMNKLEEKEAEIEKLKKRLKELTDLIG